MACWQADQLVDRLIQETGGTSASLYLTGGDNYRLGFNPQYKANRTDQPRPRHLQDLREHLVVRWGAKVTDGCEADDALGIEQCSSNEETCIVSLDKDLLMIPGKHYSWEIGGRTATGSWTRPAFWTDVTEISGMRHFYAQLILGDKADNLFGFDGLARPKVPKKLEWMFERIEELDDAASLCEFVLDQYQDFEGMTARGRFYMNANCLYIQQKENERWVPPIDLKEEGDTHP